MKKFAFKSYFFYFLIALLVAGNVLASQEGDMILVMTNDLAVKLHAPSHGENDYLSHTNDLIIQKAADQLAIFNTEIAKAITTFQNIKSSKDIFECHYLQEIIENGTYGKIKALKPMNYIYNFCAYIGQSTTSSNPGVLALNEQNITLRTHITNIENYKNKHDAFVSAENGTIVDLTRATLDEEGYLYALSILQKNTKVYEIISDTKNQDITNQFNVIIKRNNLAASLLDTTNAAELSRIAAAPTSDNTIFMNIINHPAVDAASLLVIARRPEANIETLHAVLNHPKVAAQCLQPLASHPLADADLLQDISGRTDANPETLISIMQRPFANITILHNVIIHPNVTAPCLQLMASHQNVDTDILLKLANHLKSDAATLLTVIQNPKTTNAIFRVAAVHPNINKKDLHTIATLINADAETLLTVANNQETDSSGLRAAITHPNTNAVVLTAAAAHRNATVDIISTVVQNPITDIIGLRVVFVYPKINIDILLSIARHPAADLQIKRDVLSHPLININVLDDVIAQQNNLIINLLKQFKEYQ